MRTAGVVGNAMVGSRTLGDAPTVADARRWSKRLRPARLFPQGLFSSASQTS